MHTHLHRCGCQILYAPKAYLPLYLLHAYTCGAGTIIHIVWWHWMLPLWKREIEEEGGGERESERVREKSDSCNYMYIISHS